MRENASLNNGVSKDSPLFCLLYSIIFFPRVVILFMCSVRHFLADITDTSLGISYHFDVNLSNRVRSKHLVKPAGVNLKTNPHEQGYSIFCQ